MGAAASVGGTALLHSEPMAKHLLASTAVGWALVRELRQSGKEMESSGTSCGAVCLPVLLRVFYFFFFFLLPPSSNLYRAAASEKGRAVWELELFQSPAVSLAKRTVL